MVELRRVCHRCDGTGIVDNPDPGGDYTCSICTGSGRLPTTIQVDDLMSELDDIKNKVNDIESKCNDIFELLQP